ncbi:hypothetical protein Tco_1482173 [Tanacetum coccineum]
MMGEGDRSRDTREKAGGDNQSIMLSDAATCLRKLDGKKSDTVGRSLQPNNVFRSPANMVTCVVDDSVILGNVGDVNKGNMEVKSTSSMIEKPNAFRNNGALNAGNVKQPSSWIGSTTPNSETSAT